MPKIGDALKKAVELQPEKMPETVPRSKPTSALMNPNRRKIFQFLCTYPFSGQEMISQGTVLSRSSVSWHLDRLIDAGFLQAFKDRRGKVYSPKGLVPLKYSADFTVLMQADCRNMLRTLMANPGLDKSGLGENPAVGRAGACLRRLLGSGLIKKVMDGRHARYFPTDRYHDLKRECLPVNKEFTRALLRRLAEEHLRPEIHDLKSADAVIEIWVLGQKEKLVISQLDPVSLDQK
ncbi:MAG: hypothetical protein PHU53_05690 [Thermoplasmata archaeon]|nr:hypothetical protein [Thermoplasmata archaeon]